MFDLKKASQVKSTLVKKVSKTTRSAFDLKKVEQ